METTSRRLSAQQLMLPWVHVCMVKVDHSSGTDCCLDTPDELLLATGCGQDKATERHSSR